MADTPFLLVIFSPYYVLDLIFLAVFLPMELKDKPFVIVDMFSGSYNLANTGHEAYNLIPCPKDGRYYGYCPPYGTFDIGRLGDYKDKNSATEVIVVYTQKQCNSSDRVVIGFTDNATINRKPNIDPSLGRQVWQDGKVVDCSYIIESDYMYDLSDYPVKFNIRLADYHRSMFRGQRVFKGKYPSLDKALIEYLEEYLNNTADDDSLVFQKLVQEEDVSGRPLDTDTSLQEPQYILAGGSKVVNKKPGISKQAVAAAGYRCAVDGSHITFKTPKGVPYMEGHHLIPCTFTNSRYFWKEKGRNIDCIENIVCLCPNCHRKIHFGSAEEKAAIIEDLFGKREESLTGIGLDISLDELKKLYR